MYSDNDVSSSSNVDRPVQRCIRLCGQLSGPCGRQTATIVTSKSSADADKPARRV